MAYWQYIHFAITPLQGAVMDVVIIAALRCGWCYPSSLRYSPGRIRGIVRLAANGMSVCMCV